MLDFFIELLFFFVIPNIITIFLFIWILNKEKIFLFPYILVWLLCSLLGIRLIKSDFWLFLKKASPDGVVSGIGSFGGALLAGILTASIAIYIMGQQFSNERGNMEKEDLNNELKTMLMLGYWFSPAKNALETIIKDISTGNIKGLNGKLNHFKNHIDELQKIDQSHLSYDLYLSTYALIHHFVYCYQFIDGVQSTLGHLHLKSNINVLKKQYDEIDKLFNSFLTVQTSKTNEYKRLDRGRLPQHSVKVL